MSNIENPEIQIKIFTEFGDLEFNKEDIEVRIEKDLEEEPNDARVIIHNLNPSNRQSIIDAGKENAPIEIYGTQFGTTDLVRAFAGEIDNARPSIPIASQVMMTQANHVSTLEPGLEMIINCTSQKQNHRAFYVEPKNWVKGTEYASIINWMADQVGLPKRMGNLPAGKTKYSYSISGIAFDILKKYCSDFGLTAYILDGVLHVTDIFSPTDTTPIEIDYRILFESPEHTTRSDSEQVEIQTVRLNKAGDIKKRIFKKKLVGPSDYVSTDSVDINVEGRIYKFPLRPDLNPDQLIKIQDEETRIKVVTHEFDNLHDSSLWDTTVEADLDVFSI